MLFEPGNLSLKHADLGLKHADGLHNCTHSRRCLLPVVLADAEVLGGEILIAHAQTLPINFPSRYWLNGYGNGTEIVMLDGTQSSDDVVILEYIWRKDGQIIANGSMPQIELPVGIHQIELTTIDDDNDNSTDIVTITVNSSDTSSDLPLRLTSLCSANPDSIRVWRVRNTNPDPVDFTWDVVGTDQTGSGTVPGGSEENPGEVTFETNAVATSDTVTISVDGTVQDTVSSDSAGVSDTASLITAITDATPRFCLLPLEHLSVNFSPVYPVNGYPFLLPT